MQNVLLFFSLKYNGNWKEIYKALERKEKIDFSELETIKQKIDSEFVTILDPEYPSFLKNTHMPPFVLFYKGNIDLLKKHSKTIGIIGGENHNSYGEKQTINLIKQLINEKKVITTINQPGLNENVISESLKNKAQLILILQNGLSDFIIEKQKLTTSLLENGNLLISEVYKNLNGAIDKDNEDKNRLVSSFSKGIVFTQFSDEKNINSIASFATNDGRELFAFPSNIDEMAGTNKIIQNGAKLVQGAQDIINEI